jgi:hypothetical protein
LLESWGRLLAAALRAAWPLKSVGSVRDVVCAFNREPGLFRTNVAMVLAFIGEASDAKFHMSGAWLRLRRRYFPAWAAQGNRAGDSARREEFPEEFPCLILAVVYDCQLVVVNMELLVPGRVVKRYHGPWP